MALANPKEWSRYNNEIDKINKAIVGPQTDANASTQYARESAKDTDRQINKNGITQEVGKRGYSWDSSSGSGSKKLGSGAYGTVMQEPNKGNAVKRGDLGVDEARLIDKVGKADLGPSLKAAQLDGETDRPNTRLGRLAMSVVPGKPIGQRNPDTMVNGVKISDAYWKARADLHRMGIAHNDMHIDNVFVDRKGKGRFVDMGLAQESPKAALAEAIGAFSPPAGSQATRGRGGQGQGDWQVRRWNGTGGELLSDAEVLKSVSKVNELNSKAPLLGRVRLNKTAVWNEMTKDGFSKDDIATVMDHGIRSPLDSYDRGVWERMSDDQANNYINMLYEGV
jgi:serine/threonine protein kinase